MRVSAITDQPLVSRTRRTAALSAREQRDLAFALEAPTQWVDCDCLHAPDAEHRLMRMPAAIARPNMSWYSPWMETVGPSPKALRSATQDSMVLTRDQERDIFHKYNYARLREGQLRLKHEQRALTPRQGRELISWHRTATALRGQIAEINLPLVLAMAGRSRVRDAEYGDLIAEGNMALLRAIDKFDVDRGFKFSTYACRAILKSFTRWGMKQTRYRQRVPGRLEPGFDHTDWPEALQRAQLRESAAEVGWIVEHNTADLSELEQDVLHHRFGLGKVHPGCEDGGPMTLAQVGQTIGLTKERVRQIQNQALNKLRAAVSVN